MTPEFEPGDRLHFAQGYYEVLSEVDWRWVRPGGSEPVLCRPAALEELMYFHPELLVDRLRDRM